MTPLGTVNDVLIAVTPKYPESNGSLREPNSELMTQEPSQPKIQIYNSKGSIMMP